MKIVAPVMPRNVEEAQSIDVSKYQDVNLIEWRADFLPKEDIVSVAPAILKNLQVERLFLPFVQVKKEGILHFLIRNMLI